MNGPHGCEWNPQRGLWPHRSAGRTATTAPDLLRCGEPAPVYLATGNGTGSWGRWLCELHGPWARERGWAEPADPNLELQP